jgi:aryl carrier-like protein
MAARRGVAQAAPPLSPEAALAAWEAAQAGPAWVVILPSTPPVAAPTAWDAETIDRELRALLAGRLSGPLDPERPLWDQGMDSLALVELRNALLANGRPVPLGPLLRGPPLVELVALVQAGAPTPPTPTPPAAAPPEGPPTALLAALGGALLALLVAAALWSLS